MATKTKKPVHSFSTNFFGVLGYVGSSFVWLLAITASVYLLPVSEDVQSVWTSVATDVSTESEAASPLLTMLLYVALIAVIWAFAYFASRILSRIVRRIGLLFSRKVTYDVLFKTKYFIHAWGLILLVLMLLIAPIDVTEKNTIALMGLVSGLVGISAVVVQRRLTERHKVPLGRVL